MENRRLEFPDSKYGGCSAKRSSELCEPHIADPDLGEARWATSQRQALATIPDPIDFSQKSLDLPPMLLLETKLLSPTTVLEGPYVGRSRFQSSSFRIVGRECYGSFSPDHERSGSRSGQLGALVLSKSGVKERGWFDSWGRRVLKGKREVGGANYVFPSSVDGESDGGGGSVGESSSFKVKNTRHRRPRSFSTLSFQGSFLGNNLSRVEAGGSTEE